MQKPSEQAINETKNEYFSEVDSKGRKLTVREPGMLAQYRLVGMLGKAADSETYLNMCMPLIYLHSIDEDDNITVNTQREMEALIQRLGGEGIETLMKLVQENFSEASKQDASEIKK